MRGPRKIYAFFKAAEAASLCSISNPVAGCGGAAKTGTDTELEIVAPAEFTPVTVIGNVAPVSAFAKLTCELSPSAATAKETFASEDDHCGTEPDCNAPFGVAVN